MAKVTGFQPDIPLKILKHSYSNNKTMILKINKEFYLKIKTYNFEEGTGMFAQYFEQDTR